jgi:hypothetical protein
MFFLGKAPVTEPPVVDARARRSKDCSDLDSYRTECKDAKKALAAKT